MAASWQAAFQNRPGCFTQSSSSRDIARFSVKNLEDRHHAAIRVPNQGRATCHHAETSQPPRIRWKLAKQRRIQDHLLQMCPSSGRHSLQGGTRIRRLGSAVYCRHGGWELFDLARVARLLGLLWKPYIKQAKKSKLRAKESGRRHTT